LFVGLQPVLFDHGAIKLVWRIPLRSGRFQVRDKLITQIAKFLSGRLRIVGLQSCRCFGQRVQLWFGCGIAQGSLMTDFWDGDRADCETPFTESAARLW
jgi:hypothetical protein